jgi:signal transduction histidine kinase
MNRSLISFRMKLIMIMLLAISIPVLTTGYFMIDKAEKALLKEKEKKLFSIAKQLDYMLKGTFDNYLDSSGNTMTRAEKIRRLNSSLGPLTDMVAADNAGVGVGYYSSDLDAVITYGPSSELGDKIGLSISETHPGRYVLQNGKPLVFTGKQVRGDIMNAMVPLIREHRIIGYVWANELTSDVVAQMRKMERNILLILAVGMLAGMTVALQMANALGGSIDKIIRSIDRIGNDLSYRLPASKGVLGKIPLAINGLMNRLVETKTHTEAMEEQIRRVDRLKALGELAAGMAHEIRNPLTSIKAFSQITEESMEEGDPNLEYIGIIVKEVERMNGLVEQLLLFGRPSIKKEVEVYVPDLINHSLVLVEYDLRKKRLKVMKQLENIKMFADYNLIQQIIINLLLNAIQAANQGGTLEIKTFAAGNRIGMSFFNTGSYIDNDQKEMIFNPFFTSEEKGMGLGLSVTQNIVHLYNGTICFENVDTGVKFQVEFPGKEIANDESSSSR